MTYTNDRRLVETVNMTLSFSMILVQGVSPEFKETKEQILSLLTESLNNLVQHLDHKKRTKIMQRCRYSMENGFVTEALKQNSHAAKIGLALYYFIKNMQEQNLFYYAEGSAFDKALSMILPCLEDWANQDRFDKSSFKEARKMLSRYQAVGYYTDVKWVLEYS